MTSLLSDFTYLEMSRTLFLRSAEIYRTLQKKSRTISSTADCLIAACALEESASLLENLHDFHSIAEFFPLKLLLEP